MRILITAFEPYGRWETNASQLAATEFLSRYAGPADLIVRHYPVRFEGLPGQLAADLADVDAALLTGQSSRASAIELEAVALNVRTEHDDSPGPFHRLSSTGPLALASPVALDSWLQALSAVDIPAEISHHAGTFLCNAAYYLALAGQIEQARHQPVAFVHIPLTPAQVPPPQPPGVPLPTSISAQALDILVAELVTAPPPALT